MVAMLTGTEELDFGALIPPMDTVMGWIELALRVAVMAGPLLMLGFGLLFLLAPPKEANYGLGFRCWWGMASLESWQFTQRVAGMVWAGLGAVLTIVMALISNGFRDLDPVDMAQRAGVCLIWELVLVAIAWIVINVIVIKNFDKDGFRRGQEEE